MKPFEVLFADEKPGYDRWLDCWERSMGREPFQHPGYALLFAGSGVRAMAAVMQGAEGGVFCAYLLRLVPAELSPERETARLHYDLITPYGYGGAEVFCAPGQPMPDARVQEALYAGFEAGLTAWARENGVVCEFVRFSLFSPLRSQYGGQVLHSNDNVVVDLEKPLETLWGEYRYKVRRGNRLAQKNGLYIREDYTGEGLNGFKEVYLRTMKRNNASSFYFFYDSFFSALIKQMKGHFCLFHQFNGNRQIASVCVLLGHRSVYCYLMGNLELSATLGAALQLQHHIIAWAREKGYSHYVLGGGLKKNDGIFAFKKAFAPGGIVPFYTGRRVFDQRRYETLVAVAREQRVAGPEGFFPAYRFQ